MKEAPPTIIIIIAYKLLLVNFKFLQNESSLAIYFIIRVHGIINSVHLTIPPTKKKVFILAAGGMVRTLCVIYFIMYGGCNQTRVLAKEDPVQLEP
jgi:hypothetical protein